LKKFDAIHPRHALVRKHEGDTVVADLQLLKDIERFLRRVAPDHTIFSPVLRAEVAFDCTQYIGIIIHA